MASEYGNRTGHIMLQKLSIRQKIFGIVLLPILLAVATAIVAVFQLNQTAAGMKAAINDQGLIATEYILNADRDIYQALNNIQEMVTVPADSPRLEELKESYAENVGQTLERLDLAENALEADRAL